MLSYLNKRVAVAFIVLPNEIPNLSRDPLANKIPFEKLYLLRMRELNKAYSMQYIANESAIDNLYSWEALATERVLGTIIGVIGDGDCARQAAAAIRSSRVLETPEEVLFRTMVSLQARQWCMLAEMHLRAYACLLSIVCVLTMLLTIAAALLYDSSLRSC